MTFDAAHRVLRHESKCSTLHGHTYKVELTVEAPTLDAVGRVVDFGEIKERFGGWVDNKLDHTTIVNSADRDLLDWCTRDHERNGKRKPYAIDCEPTAENLAAHLLVVAQALLENRGLTVVHVRVWETPNCFADASPTDMVEPDAEVRANRDLQNPPR